MNTMPLTNEPTSTPQTLKNKFFDFYMWSKVLSVTFNMMYMIQTFEDMYDAGSNIGKTTQPTASNQQKVEKYTVPLQYGFQILIGCLMMFCLIVDLIILTTSKVSIADWYWRPGVFFFTFTCGNEIILIVDLLFNNDTFFQNCQQKLTGTHTSLILISEVCNMQTRLNHIVTLSIVFRDVLICGAYVAVSYFYVLRLVQVLKSRASSDTAMHVMASSYNYPITQ